MRAPHLIPVLDREIRGQRSGLLDQLAQAALVERDCCQGVLLHPKLPLLCDPEG